MTIALQHTMFGGPVVSGTISDRIEYLLEQYPEARDDYMVLTAIYWIEFDGLADVLGERTDKFREWFVKHATSQKTVQNRCMEVQNKNPHLEASTDVEKRRRRQATQGPVNRN